MPNNLAATAGWDDVPQWERDTPLLGGPGGQMNAQAQALFNRTELLNKLYFGVTNPANPAFAGGIKCDGSDDTAAIKAAIDAAPSGSTLAFPPGVTCMIQAGQIKIDKSLQIEFNNAKLKHNGTGSGPLIYIARDASTPAGDIQPFYTLSRIGLRNLRLAGQAEVDVSQYDTGAAQGLVPDLRTSLCDGLYLEDVDAVKLDNVAVRDMKGSGLVLGSKSSVRECVFDNLYILQCGSSAAQTPSIKIISPVPSANNGIHNHIYFEHLRVINSFWKSIEVTRGATVAAAFGSFIIEFNHAQIDNSMPVAGPMGPNCDMVDLSHCGWHITFNNSVILNPYGQGGGKWGNACVKVGSDAYADSKVERVEFINTRFQHANYGHGVRLARANMARFTQCSWASEATKSRSIVVANVNPGDNYGTASAVTLTPYVLLDASNEYSDTGPYLYDPAYAKQVMGWRNKPSASGYVTQVTSPGGFSSGEMTFTVNAGTSPNLAIALKDILPGLSDADAADTTWLVSAKAVLNDGSQQATGAAVAVFNDQNVVGDVFPTGLSKTNGAVLDMQMMRFNGYASGGVIAHAGNRMQVYIANASTQAATVKVRFLRWGN
jgi:hypothetical protein